MVTNKQCLACRTKFRHCPDCSKADALKPTWASEFCSEPCATLWATLTKFGMSMLTKAEAKSIISELDLKPIDTYVDCVKRDYSKVMEQDKKIRKPYKKTDLIVEEIKIEQPIEVAETVVEKPTEYEVVEKENE